MSSRNIQDAAFLKKRIRPQRFENKYSVEGINATSARQIEEMPDRRRPLSIYPEALSFLH
jgi:hypothetical protein